MNHLKFPLENQISKAQFNPAVQFGEKKLEAKGEFEKYPNCCDNLPCF